MFYRLLKYISSYRISTRVLVIILMLLLSVAITMGSVLYSVSSGKEYWAAAIVVVPLVFAILSCPIGITLMVDLQSGGQDVVEAFNEDPGKKPPYGLLDPRFNDWYIGR